MKLHIRGGHLVDPANERDGRADLHIAAGRIVGVGEAPAGFAPDRVIEAEGLVVCPGLVDLSARLREPGYEYKATLESELQAAVAGGVTSLVCPPDTDPPLDEPGLVEMLKHRARMLNQAHVYPLGALTVGLKGADITEMAELYEAGCVAFSQANVALADTQVMLRAMQYAKTFDYAVWLRPQELHLAAGGVAASGAVATRLGLPSVPVIAETIALHTIFELQKATGVRVHLCRLSSAAGIELVRAAKREGLPVTCDVSVNHLHLIDMDIGYFEPNCRLDPPLRGQRDRDAIRAALADGTIDAVCSDHTPVDDDAKLMPFDEAEPGATGLELLLSLTLKWAQEANVPLSAALAKLSSAPARVLGLPCGGLQVGMAADVCIFDPQALWPVDPARLASQGKNTPFTGLPLPAEVRYTLVGGQVAYERR